MKPPMTLLAVWLTLAVVRVGGFAADAGPTFRQIYIGEIGHLGAPYGPETFVEAIGMTIGRFTDDSVVIRGEGDAGDPWTVVAKVSRGVGFTEAWHGDIDANGRADLIILQHFPKSGGCGSTSQLTTLMVDSRGRPVPWEIVSSIDLHRALYEEVTDIALPRLPPPGVAELVDLDGDRRAEFVQIECFDGETSIRAVYEVEDARWRQVSTSAPNMSAADYAHALRGLRFPPLPEPSERYFIDEVANAIDGAKPAAITEKIARQGKCYGIVVPPFVNGRISSDDRDWQAARERNYKACNDSFVFDDGRICFGYPGIVIDRPGGREAQMVGRSAEAAALLDELIEARRPVVLTGQTDEDHCSPTVIWALEG
jgi:hypothetical protein